MHDKNLHINKGIGDIYPEPELAVEDAWEEMRKLLEKDNDAPPIVPPVPAANNGAVRKYWFLILLLIAMGTTGLLTYVFSGSTKEKAGKTNKTEYSINESHKKQAPTPTLTTTSDDRPALNSHKSIRPENFTVADSNKNAITEKTILSDTKLHPGNSYIPNPGNANNTAREAKIKETNTPTTNSAKRKVTKSLHTINSNKINQQQPIEGVLPPKESGTKIITGRYSGAGIDSHSTRILKNHPAAVEETDRKSTASLQPKNKSARIRGKKSEPEVVSMKSLSNKGKLLHQKLRGLLIQKHKAVFTDIDSYNKKNEKPNRNQNSVSEGNPPNENFKNLFYRHLSEGNRMPYQFSVASAFPDSIKANPKRNLGKIGSNLSGANLTTSNNLPEKNNSAKGLALAAGLGINQFFSIGGQQASGYNSNGTSNAFSDYIPVPMARIYFNKKAFIQLEAQFNTPQYTKKLLAKQVTTTDSMGTVPISSQQSIFIKKLFYFNLPVSFHYSPFNNFYVGAGLQFARLSNGVGLFQNTKLGQGTTADTVYFSKIGSFKTDPVYRELKTTEWRFLLDANYQLKNWILGVRYNQALSNFINISFNNNQITQSRNSSLQLYLRYTIWNNKKTKSILKSH